MPHQHASIIDLSREAATDLPYENHPVTEVNDHVMRISVMTGPFDWHRHPDSDEAFLVLEGELLLDLDDSTVALPPGRMYTVPRGVRHRTRPKGNRSVNLTFERTDMRTEMLPPPGSES